MSIIKKENITIVVDTYMKDGVEKKVWKTIGELVTMQGSDGPYQFGRMWGPTGSTEFKVFDQENKQQQPQQGQPQQGYQQQGYQQPPQQAPQQPMQQQQPMAPPQGQPMGAHQQQMQQAPQHLPHTDDIPFR